MRPVAALKYDETVQSSAQPFAEILIFELDQQRYGLATADVLEIVRAVKITPLPKAPAIVEGVINVRGAVLAVLDIRQRFRHGPRLPRLEDHFLITRVGVRSVVLRVDRVLSLSHIRHSDIEDAKAVVPFSDYVAGVAKLPDGIVLIHDPQTFLSQGESAHLSLALSLTSSLASSLASGQSDGSAR